MDMGYTFEPGSDQKKLLGGINQGQLGPTANEALRVLSLRLPSVLGGSPISPEDLLRPRVGGTAPGSAVIDSLRANGGPPAPPQAPAPLMTGAAADSKGPLNVANFSGTGSPFSSPTENLGNLANAALNPVGGPKITPGGGDQQQQAVTQTATPTTAAPASTFGMLVRLLHHGAFTPEG